MSGNSNQPASGSSQALTKLVVEGFKSLAEPEEIEIRPLTLLAGANSSGKSSAMQPLLLLKQTLEATFDPGPLLLDGPNTKFTSAEQLFSRLPGHEPKDKLSIKIHSSEGEYVESKFRKNEEGGVGIFESSFKYKGRDDYVEVCVNEDSTDEDITELLPGHVIDRSRSIEEEQEGKSEWYPARRRCFIEPTFISGGSPRMGVSPFTFEEIIQDIIHVPGLRGNPNRQYKATAVGYRFPGTFDSYVAGVINEWSESEPEKIDRLSNYLEYIGLTKSVESRQVNDTQVEIRVGQQPAGSQKERLINISDVGLGVSQVLPVLVSLIAANEGQLVYIEQPEIHLHPRAQTRLADTFVEAANRGVRVVVETHSQLLLLALQTRIAENQIDPERVMLHWFSRREDGVTEVDSQVPDEKGAFGDWPEDFSEVERQAENRYLDAAEGHLFNS